MATTNNLLDVELLKGLNNRGCLYGIILITLILGNAGLAKCVESPGIDLSRLVDSKAVIVAATDFLDVLALETKFTRDKCANGSSGDHTASKLVLLSSSPGEDLALAAESQDVVGSSGQGGDVLQLRDQSRGALSGDIFSEAQDAIVALLALEITRGCRSKEAYSECTPAVDQTSISNSKCSTVAGDELREFSALREMLGIDSAWLSFRRIQALVIIVGIAIRGISISDVFHLSFLSCLTAQCTLIIDTPGQDLVVMSKSSAVHASNSDLDNTNGLRRQQVIETRALDIDRSLSAIIFAGSQSELAGRTLTEDVDVKLLGGDFVDGRNDLGLDRFGCFGLLNQETRH